MDYLIWEERITLFFPKQRDGYSKNLALKKTLKGCYCSPSAGWEKTHGFNLKYRRFFSSETKAVTENNDRSFVEKLGPDKQSNLCP